LHPDLDNGHIPEAWIDRRQPVDEIEPELSNHEAYREASRKFKRVLNASFKHFGLSLYRIKSSDPAITQIRTAYWQICFALGLQVCEGKSMTEHARDLGVERAAISKGATMFCRVNELPVSFYMKKELSQNSYRTARIQSIRQCNGNGKH